MLQPSLFPLTVPTLRPYQQEAVEAVLRNYLSHGKTKIAIELPTRAGKTFVINEVTRCVRAITPRTRTLFLVPSISLAHQALHDAMHFFHRHEIGLIQAEHNEVGRPITIATVQTLANPIRRAQLLAAQRWERFSLVDLDECHLSLATSYQEVLADLEHPYALRLGCSATPYRGDGRSLLPVFPDGLVYTIDIQELVRDGYLLPFEAHKLQTDLDFSGLTVDGIWNAETEEEMEQIPASIIERMKQSNRYAVAFKAWEDIFQRDRILIFANDVQDIYGFHEYFTRMGAPSAIMTSKTPQDERDHILQAIHDGTTRVLIGFGVFTTGITIPRIKGAIIGRIGWLKGGYQHIGIHQQSIGRVIGLSDEQDAQGNPVKTVGKVAYLVTKEYNTIPPVMSMGCLPGDMEKLKGKKGREELLKQVDEELGVESTPMQREAYTPLEITLKLRTLDDQVVDLFIGDGWQAHPDGSFSRITKDGTLSVQREGVACYSISLEKDGTIIPIPFQDPAPNRDQGKGNKEQPSSASLLTTARQALAQASHYIVRMRLHTPLQQGDSIDKSHLITQEDQTSLLRYLKQQRRIFLPHGLSQMTYTHSSQIQSLLKKHGDAFPVINGKKCQLSFDQGRIFFRILPEKTKKDGTPPKKKKKGDV